ncbi:MAG: TraB/GumN family protein [Dokdonella sp.]
MNPVEHDTAAAEPTIPSVPSVLAEQPLIRVVRDDVEYVLLGTAHVSRASVDAVNEILATESFDAVAVELCDPRYRSMLDPEAFRKMDLFQVIRQGKVRMVAANLMLGAFQRRIADQFGIEPGAEMKAAIDGAQERGLPLWLIDREVATTLRRAMDSVGFFERMGISAGLIGGLISHSNVSEEEVEKLKEGDMLGSMFNEFANESPKLFEALIAERDRYMTAKLRTETIAASDRDPPLRRVLVVLGAGHLAGISAALQSQDAAPEPLIAELSTTPPPSRWGKWIAIGIFVAIAVAIGVLFSRGGQLGAEALQVWVICTAVGAAFGALLAGGHPLSVLAAAIAGPLKPFRPGVPSGAIAAGVEVLIRRPRVGDFDNLRDDVTHWTGWWKNRVSRTLLVFILTNFGTMFGTWIAGFRIFKSLL